MIHVYATRIPEHCIAHRSLVCNHVGVIQKQFLSANSAESEKTGNVRASEYFNLSVSVSHSAEQTHSSYSHKRYTVFSLAISFSHAVNGCRRLIAWADSRPSSSRALYTSAFLKVGDCVVVSWRWQIFQKGNLGHILKNHVIFKNCKTMTLFRCPRPF